MNTGAIRHLDRAGGMPRGKPVVYDMKKATGTLKVADYLCTMQLAALKYRDRTSTATDEKFFGP